MVHTGMAAGAGVAMVAAGRSMARPVQATLGEYSVQENASTQLSASMMLADGSVSKEFKALDQLAKRLGDRLPGTTADFLELMAVLTQQGLGDGTILGGTGEAAALLGVQLRMNIPAAGEFAAKMQDATRTAEKDMMGLMDTIQRSYYMGVDSNNMLQGFSKMSPVMSILNKEGLEFSNMMAPLLVMMDQTGMAGESAGNAIRKVFQGGLNTKKLEKANELLKSSKAGFQLKFTDKGGAFLGMDNVFAQLEKLKGLGNNAVLRTGVMQALFGDDSETLQVLNSMMDKGMSGYQEVADKMAAQATLQQREDQQLGT
jgi:TP901 family phage tail tape measure protein